MPGAAGIFTYADSRDEARELAVDALITSLHDENPRHGHDELA